MANYNMRWITLPAPKKEDPFDYTFDELYSEYWGTFHKLYFYSIKDWHEAEDLAQITMIKIWRYWDRIQWNKLAGAMATIVNCVRHDHVTQKLSKMEDDFSSFELEFDSHDEGVTDPLRTMITERAMSAVNEFLGVLDGDEKELFLDFYTRSKTIDEVCEEHKIKRTNAYVQLHRIRELLTECFERYDLVPEGNIEYGKHLL